MIFKDRFTSAKTNFIVINKSTSDSKSSNRRNLTRSVRKIILNNGSTTNSINVRMWIQDAGGTQLNIVPSLDIPAKCGVVFNHGVAYDNLIYDLYITTVSSDHDLTVIIK